MVCAWPSRGITETQTRIPAQLIADATTRIVELWPWEHLQHEPPERPPHLSAEANAGADETGLLMRDQKGPEPNS